GEGLVGFGHLLEVVLALDRRADAVGRVHQLVGQAFGHGALPTGPGETDDPTDRERGRTTRTNLDGNLVGRTTDAATLDLEFGADVLDGLLHRRKRIRTGLGLDLAQRVVDDLLGGA